MTHVAMGELRQTVGILMYMSVVRLPDPQLFWKKAMSITAVSKVMTKERFNAIVSILQLSNNRLQPAGVEAGHDRLYKVRPILTLLNQNFKQCAETERIVSLNEQEITFKETPQLKSVKVILIIMLNIVKNHV
jgi:hypothetical protein